ncbi:hypothetical protein GOP47_0012246 [Adiantum capillus-veneris]|uniref:Uncharacterized protein n=1 Tax=Adiantum capillus-veneris TaxID=13818 RepID=A0A9D4UQN4_ADICA|nr:hypothetical protein GOP47_0012246 [Adiantum capillus-veneris]
MTLPLGKFPFGRKRLFQRQQSYSRGKSHRQGPSLRESKGGQQRIKGGIEASVSMYTFPCTIEIAAVSSQENVHNERSQAQVQFETRAVTVSEIHCETICLQRDEQGRQASSSSGNTQAAPKAVKKIKPTGIAVEANHGASTMWGFCSLHVVAALLAPCS